MAAHLARGRTRADERAELALFTTEDTEATEPDRKGKGWLPLGPDYFFLSAVLSVVKKLDRSVGGGTVQVPDQAAVLDGPDAHDGMRVHIVGRASGLE